MKRSRKKVSPVKPALDVEGALRDLFINQPKLWLREARERLRDLPKSNFDLACRFAKQGKWFDAVFRFRVVLFLRPDYPHAQYNLGGCYVRMGRTAEAKAALLKALRQTPDNPDVAFMLASVDPAALPAERRPKEMPEGMVTGFFGNIAEGYDVTEAGNKYQAGKVIHAFAQPLLTAPAPVIEDWACGSGIAARPWRAAAARIHGVDVTPAMVALAQAATHVEKQLYEEVSVADIRALPDGMAEGKADLVLLINAAQFIGDLSAVMRAAAAALRAGGLFVLTAEPIRAADGYGLVVETGRFGHAASYVQQVAVAAGLTLEKEATVELYAGVPVQAFAFRKGNS